MQQLRDMLRKIPIRRLLRGLAEYAIVVCAFGTHELLRGLVSGSTSEAIANGQGVMRLERSLGIFWELDVQHWVLAHPEIRNALDFSYIHLHMIVIALFAFWVCFFHQDHVRNLRNIFIGILAVAIPTYLLFPLAPPRFFPQVGFVDTVKIFGGVNYEATQSILSNSFAAMPSLHAGWALFIAIGIVRIKRKPIYYLGFLYFALMVTSIVATGNHYILDAVGGSIVTIGAYLLVPRLVARLPWSVESRRARKGLPVPPTPTQEPAIARAPRPPAARTADHDAAHR